MAYTYKHGDRPLDGYTIQRAVGSGGFGQVYYALSDGGREVALKYLKDNPQVELRGVSHCINLKSPHLISIFDVKKNADGEFFLVMEYCSGPSLRDLLIAEPDGFGPQKAAFFVRELAKGLAYLHDRGIVHRDLKPGNVFFDDGYVKIGDYGLSKFISLSRHSAQTASVGTVHYMAPEIGSGNYSRGVDIYALGVMLYEMLLGRVPFEGSTMGEVLMKHLTAQPAVDELPFPFANVIRRALLKDPKDRYQNVNEMVDELLSVEDVQQSLAGFSVKSLEGAVRRGGTDALASPIPSPNPAMRFGGAVEVPVRAAQQPGAYRPLPDRLARKLDRISRRVDARINRFGGRPPAERVDIAMPRMFGGGPAPHVPPIPRGTTSAGKRMLLSIILTVGLSIIVGVVIGLVSEIEEVGAAAGMLVPAMWGGILLTRRATRWFDVDVGPLWSRRLVALACSAPLLAIGAAPALDRHGHEALGLLIGLAAVSVFTRWEREFTEGAAGDLRIGAAVRAAIFALVMTGIGTAISDGEPMYMAVAATIAGVVSICLQPTAWWLWGGKPDEIAKMNQRPGSQKHPDPAAHAAGGWGRGVQAPPPPPYAPQPAQPPFGAIAQSTSQGVGSSAPAGVAQLALPQRWGITRAFWALAAFVFMGGAIITFLIPLTSDLHGGGVVESVTTCVAFTAAMLFALRKTTPFKREGFWRETFRPFLISLSLFGIGATITALAGGGSDKGKDLQVLMHEDAEDDADALLALDSIPTTLEPGIGVPKAPLPPEECEDTQARSSEGKTWKERIRAERDRGRARAQRWRENLGQMIEFEMGHRHWRTSNTAACIVGLVFSSLIFVTLLLFTGRRRRIQAPFIRLTDSGQHAPIPSPAFPKTDDSQPTPKQP